MGNRSCSVNIFKANRTMSPENFAHAITKQQSGKYYTDKYTKLLTSRRTSVIAVSDRTTRTFCMYALFNT
jgi:hypothetical protein